MCAFSCYWCWVLIGSAATGIPTGALIVVSPLETLASFGAWRFEEDSIDVDRDGEVIGRLQVRWMVLLPRLFFCFFFNFPEKLFFLCFYWIGRRMMLGV